MRLLEHPAVRHALAAVDSVLNNRPFINGDQARQIIVVEMTHDCEVELRMCIDYYNVHHAASSTPRERLRASELRQHDGPMTIMGIRFYRVDYLPDGDTWRVLNALGVN